MSLVGLILLFALFFAFILIIIGIITYRKGSSRLNKPTLLGISALLLLILLIVLFFSGTLLMINKKIGNIFWWGTVLYSFIIGIKEIKNNIFISLLIIFYSVLLGMTMGLLTFITSM